MKTASFALLMTLLVSASDAFTPIASNHHKLSTTQLHAESRREALSAIGLALGGLMGLPEASNALNNPALETFKGRKATKGQFIPGKGLRNHEDENWVALKNPALETFKGGKKTKGEFIPGKGLRMKEDELLALKNPALETFKGGKKTKGEFIPGKGLRLNESFESMMG